MHGSSRPNRLLTLPAVLGALLAALPASAGVVPFADALVEETEIPRLLAEAAAETAAVSDVVAPAPTLQSWGTNWSSWTFGPCDSGFRHPDRPFETSNCNVADALNYGVHGSLGFPLHLPHGSVLQYIYYWYFDNHTTSNVSAGLWSTDTIGTQTLVQLLEEAAPVSGGNAFYQSAAFSHTVDNWNNSYDVLMNINKNLSERESFYRGIAFYKLQVSPAPAVATFTDVPADHQFFQHIEALVDSGVTAGCGDGNYCPDAPISRGQMAVFLVKALGLSWASDVTP